MSKNLRKILAIILIALAIFVIIRNNTSTPQVTNETSVAQQEQVSSDKEDPVEVSSAEVSSEEESGQYGIEEDGTYDTKDEVALYIHLYNHLPSNYMTKDEARKLGWEGGALHLVVEGKCIGGDEFYNNEGILPEKAGRTYYECDIDTLNSTKRGAKRIIFSNDGLIYYTSDHYETFEQLY